MLNRFGLVDIDKILREQGEGDPAGPPDQAGAPPGGAPPDQAPEDPNEKIDQAREKNQATDLVSFRRKHADLIYRVAQQNDPADYGWLTSLQSLQEKFEESGNDEPFFVLFDPQTSGLSGSRHLSLIASMHRGRLAGSRIQFPSGGEAAEFAEKAGEVRDDLEFTTDEQDPTVVRFQQAQQAEPETSPSAPPAPAPPAPPA